MLRRLFALFLIWGAVRAESPLLSGDYDRLVVGESEDTITGFFHDCTGDCKFQCDVFFEGKRSGTDFQIIAYYPEYNRVINGKLTARGKKLHIKLSEGPDGCGNVEPDFNGAGVKFLLNKSQPWLEIRMVRNDAPFRGQSGAIRKGQLVAVIQKSKDWVLVQFPGKKGIQGWINTRNLFPLKL